MQADVLDAWKSAGPLLTPYISPIRTDEQLAAALELFAELWPEAAHDSSSLYAPLFNLLAERIEAYEDQVYPVPDAPPAQMLASAIEQKGVTQKDVGAATGVDQSNLSKILRGERGISAEQARRFAAYFSMDVSAFV